MRCVLVSKSLDLRGYLGPQFMRAADRIEMTTQMLNRTIGGGVAIG